MTEPTDPTLSDVLASSGGAVVSRPANELTPHDLAATLGQYEEVMLAEIGSRGLPTTQVLVPLVQRSRMLSNLDGAMELLDAEHRAVSLYLSKFVMAVGAGLFDAALNYLWDETITELRRRVVKYDLKYFYDLAVTAPDRRNKLNSADDLANVQDSELIAACTAMGMVSDIGFKQLDLVRHMRNYASAAHPNQNELTGLQLSSFLETCIREVIALPETNVMAEVRRLLANVKTQAYTADGAKATASFFGELPTPHAGNLGQGLFGIYVDPASPVVARDNVRLLMPRLWPFLDEEVRRGFGVRYGRFVANGDQQQADLAREVLDAVGAVSYLPESVRVAEIDAALDALRSAHDGMDNFYTEPPQARALAAIVGADPVPESLRSKYVLTLVDAFLGRGSGIAWNADPIYRTLLGQLTPADARVALLTFLDLGISSTLQHARPKVQFSALLDILEPKLVDQPARDLFAAMRAFTGPADTMRIDSNLRRLAEVVSAQQ